MDAQTKKQALRMFSYGVYILGLKHGDTLNASTVSWVSQVSFEPPLVMVALRNDSLTRDMVEGSGCFTINVVGENQTAMAGAFFKQAQAEGNRLNGYAVEPGPATGAPIFADAPAWLECKVVEMVKRGDHTVAIAEVVNVGVRDSQIRPLPLAATAWHYGG